MKEKKLDFRDGSQERKEKERRRKKGFCIGNIELVSTDIFKIYFYVVFSFSILSFVYNE